MEYITLTRDDPEFNDYLLGTFSTTYRALPVETYHAHTVKERVTFRVVPVTELGVPPWWRVYLRSCRPDLFGLTLAPAVAAWLNHAQQLADWERWPSWFALAGIFFLHTGIFLFNDLQDHIQGADRLNRRRGSQVIQKGWVAAFHMRRWAWLNLALAAAFGLPAFLNAPLPLLAICAAAALALLVVVRKQGARWGLTDLALLLLFGPLLTMGIALASFGETSLWDAALGLAFGATTLWVFQVRQFEDLFRSKPDDFRTFLAYFEFNYARRICLVEGAVLLALHALVAGFLRVPLVLLALLPLASLPLIFALIRFRKSASPLSSNLLDFNRRALLSHMAISLWWIAALGALWL